MEIIAFVEGDLIGDAALDPGMAEEVMLVWEMVVAG